MSLTIAQKKALKKIPTEWTAAKDLGTTPVYLSTLIALATKGFIDYRVTDAAAEVRRKPVTNGG